MNIPLHIIYIEDNPDDVMLTEYALKKAGLEFTMQVVDTEKEFLKVISGSSPHLVLSDHSLPGFNSLEAYRIIKEKLPGTPFILLTGSVSEQFAVDCLLAGIDDYILKSNLIRLPSSIERVLSKKKITEEKETIETLLQELQATYKQIELKNKEITDSINYAKRIQDAILPFDDSFNKDFFAAFVIYEPRDIVSGDLYWLASTRTTDEKNLFLKVLAVVDCTGHGIPGAFMSLLVSVLLNETLKNKDINSPGDVLSYLNKKLPSILNKNSKERITDGLDIALCAIDRDSNKLLFSGANRPLWIIRPENNSHTVIELKPTKASIGSNTPSNQVFETSQFQLLKKDRVFLFTDGITDQFGGPNGKKLGRQKLKELLINSAMLPAQEQRKYISDFLTNWRGPLEQVDDMLMIGIEIG